MSRRIHGRGIAAAALVLALALTAPVHAVGLTGWGLPSSPLLHVWHWLMGGWAGGPAPAPAEGRGRGGRVEIKAGMGVDPNGGNGLGTGLTTGSTAAPDAGAGVDPNGG
jgi:hypothetical protein